MTGTVRDLLAGGRPVVLLRVLPAEDRRGRARALAGDPRSSSRCGPTFVSVTYGAGGSTRDRTVAITERIAHRDHADCRSATSPRSGHSRRRAAAGRRPVRRRRACATSSRCAATRPATRRPSGRSTPRACAYADELVRLVKALGDFCVGVAAFPEKHPRVAGPRTPTPGTSWRRPAPAPTSRSPRCSSTPRTTSGCATGSRALGCDVPIIPGHHAGHQRARRSSGSPQLSGRRVPGRTWPSGCTRSRTTRRRCARSASRSRPSCARRLLDEGAPGLHFYTLNRSTATREVYAALGLAAPLASA